MSVAEYVYIFGYMCICIYVGGVNIHTHTHIHVYGLCVNAHMCVADQQILGAHLSLAHLQHRGYS